MENVWAGFDNLIRAFFISYFDNNKKMGFVAESYFIYSPFLFMRVLVVYYLFH